MKFFLDTADVEEIKQGLDLGLVNGVTTNPSLIAKTGKERNTVLAEICEIVDGPVSGEVISTNYDEMIKEAKELRAIHPNIVIKLPLIEDGLKATKTLTEDGARVNVTLCFSALQALLAAKAGATFISPFVGRLDDISSPGMQLIEQIAAIYNNYDFDTEILVASIRHPMHMLEAALIGAHVATIPFGVARKFIKHPLTDIGLEQFLSDHRKSQNK